MGGGEKKYAHNRTGRESRNNESDIPPARSDETRVAESAQVLPEPIDRHGLPTS